MRILMLLDQPYPPDLRVENEARSLQAAGHEVRVLSVGPDGRDALETLSERVSVRRLNVSQRRVNRMRALAATLGYADSFYRRAVLDAFDEWPFEAIHAHELYLAGGAVRAAKALGVPCTVDLHEHWTRVLDDYVWSSGFPRRWIVGRRRWRRYERRHLERADALVVVGDVMAEDYRYLGRPIIPVPNYVSLEGYGSWMPEGEPLRQGTPSVLYAGGLVPNRGLDTAIRAMPRILREAGPVRLDIVGDGVERARLEGLASEHGVRDSVRFAGRVAPEEIPAWVQGARVGINPLRRSGQTDVALSHKLFQYMLGSRPVVVTDCPAMAQVVRDARAGFVVPDRDVDAYADAVVRLLADPDEAARLGGNGRKAVLDRYNWEAGVRPLLDWYAGAAGTGSQGWPVRTDRPV